MHSEDIQLFRMLVEAGAQPGEDFSYDLSQSACHVSERGFILLQNAFPQIDWPAISSLKQRDLQAPVKVLHQMLGVNFVDSLMQRVQQRLEQLPTDAAAWYAHQILGGVEQRTGIALYQLMQQTLPQAVCQHLDQLLKLTPITTCNFWIEDLVLAAGGTPDDVSYDGNEVLLSEAGITLLNQVWTGELEVHDEMAA